MLDSADDARRIAAVAVAALRLVNETAAESLVAAADRGETRAQLVIEPVEIPVAAGLAGRLYDQVLSEALERAGQAAVARACRMLIGLGFSVSTAPEVERDQDIDRVGEAVRRIRLSFLELGYATAQEFGRAAPPPLLQGVVLPQAHLWRARAESARILAQYERGADHCRLPWRDFGSGPADTAHLDRLAEALRRRGFRVETVETGATLRVNW